MIPILIPSRSRATAYHVSRGPWSQIPDGWPVWYVVPAEQHQAYLDLGLPAVARPPEVMGMSMVREYLCHMAVHNKYEKFMMFDDDIIFFRRAAPDSTKLVREDSVADMMAEVEKTLDTYGHVGVSAREGNNHAGVGDPPLLKENTRLMRAIAYVTEEFAKIEHNTVPCMSDFDATIRLLRRGVPNACLFHWAQDQRGTNTDGGCADYRTVEMHRQACHTLAAANPGLVRLREKENKTGGEFGKRTEVTIYWKKAFESSGAVAPSERGLASVATKKPAVIAPPPPPPARRT